MEVLLHTHTASPHHDHPVKSINEGKFGRKKDTEKEKRRARIASISYKIARKALIANSEKERKERKKRKEEKKSQSVSFHFLFNLIK